MTQNTKNEESRANLVKFQMTNCIIHVFQKQ